MNTSKLLPLTEVEKIDEENFSINFKNFYFSC